MGPNVIAVTDGVSEAGAIVWWRLSGKVAADKLRAAWKERGLDIDIVPDNPSPEVSLHRAVCEQQEKRRLIRPLAGVRGWAIVDEHADDKTDKLDWNQTCTVKINVVGQVAIEPSDSVLAAEIMQDFHTGLENLDPQDISGWLVRLAREVDAVGLREGGGVYFVPRSELGTWRKMVDALRAVSAHSIYEIPALRSSEAVSAILDAVQSEAEQKVKTLEEILDDNKLGARGLRSKIESCANMERKVGAYEALLGQKLEAIRERLASLQARLSEAALAAEAEDEVQS